MSRVVAVLVVLGLVGSAFLLGRGSVTASVSQSVQMTSVCTPLPGGLQADLNTKLAAAISTGGITAAWTVCNTFFTDCTAAAARTQLKTNPICGGATGGQTCVAVPTANLLAQFKQAISLQPSMTKHICATFKAACLDPTDAALLTALPRCNDMSPCHNGGVDPVCEAATATIPTPDLGEQFSCATAGKPEAVMETICLHFQSKCKQPLDQNWLKNRPRCKGLIPRHDGTLDPIN